VSCNRNEVHLAFDHHEIKGGTIWVGQLWSWFWHGFHEEVRHAYTCSWVPSCSCGHDGSIGILQGGCKSLFVVSAVPAALAKDFCPRGKIFIAWKPNRLRREIGLVSAQVPRRTYANAYLSHLELDISAQLFPSHWEFDFCVFGAWWWRELFSVNTIEQVESSSQSVVVNEPMFQRLFANIWTSLYCMIAQKCSISSNID
jgi:hypothetical protein